MCIFSLDAKFNLKDLVRETDRMFIFEFLYREEIDIVYEYMQESLWLI
jgi:hypothetical protein